MGKSKDIEYRIDNDGCYICTSHSTDTNGYPSIKRNGVQWKMNRFIWLVVHNKIPGDLHVLHKCDKRNCINPDHLFLGTHQDNMDDKVRKGRSSRMLGTQHPMSKLNEVEVRMIRRLKGEITQEKLGAIFGVDRSTIGKIQAGTIWSSL